ncbi:flagellar hook-basal body protein [Campylobacter sp. RM13119]|uniref:flagellar hook-basal body protein n=1 Tax=Campylobacter californiensis TaxID=1032243 RepID=UPI0014729DE9|nr:MULTISPECIES: flagellar hook-basal body protein [unclassified Campylobacter]MBE3605889.1 flagellar hook-basal body protein [Campylobacter sp. RM13119]MBE3610006.1 flagellar hook-basal body protein [Campylobacter sp. RM12916]
MQNGYYQATAGMVTQFNRLNVITNNLANVNTMGFKKDGVVVGDFERIFKEVHDELPLKNHTKDAAKFLNRTLDRVPQVSEQYIDFSMGGIKNSTNTLDFAIKRDDVFFLIDTPSGVRLSKNGSFSLDEDGFVVTQEGYRVLPSGYETMPLAQRGIQVPQGEDFRVDTRGNAYANNEQIAKFYMAQPREIRALEKIGDNFYKPENLDDIVDINEANVVLQGYAQMSNVNPVIEMVGLIETQRLVEMYQKVMTSHMTDLNQDAIDKLAASRG